MKRVGLRALVCVAVMAVLATAGSAQTIKQLGDLPRSEYVLNIYQVHGFHEGPEGFKLVYLDTNNEPKLLYLPRALRGSYKLLRPQFTTFDQNFLIIWKKGETLERVEWYMPKVVDYELPQFVSGAFSEEDRQVFDQVARSGELTLEVEVTGLEPVITAPGGN
ncbi:MAG: hypothetical protein ACOC8N_07005 [Spirochaetota bacterium]